MESDKQDQAPGTRKDSTPAPEHQPEADSTTRPDGQQTRAADDRNQSGHNFLKWILKNYIAPELERRGKGGGEYSAPLDQFFIITKGRDDTEQPEVYFGDEIGKAPIAEVRTGKEYAEKLKKGDVIAFSDFPNIEGIEFKEGYRGRGWIYVKRVPREKFIWAVVSCLDPEREKRQAQRIIITAEMKKELERIKENISRTEAKAPGWKWEESQPGMIRKLLVEWTEPETKEVVKESIEAECERRGISKDSINTAIIWLTVETNPETQTGYYLQKGILINEEAEHEIKSQITASKTTFEIINFEMEERYRDEAFFYIRKVDGEYKIYRGIEDYAINQTAQRVDGAAHVVVTPGITRYSGHVMNSMFSQRKAKQTRLSLYQEEVTEEAQNIPLLEFSLQELNILHAVCTELGKTGYRGNETKQIEHAGETINAAVLKINNVNEFVRACLGGDAARQQITRKTGRLKGKTETRHPSGEVELMRRALFSFFRKNYPITYKIYEKDPKTGEYLRDENGERQTKIIGTYEPYMKPVFIFTKESKRDERQKVLEGEYVPGVIESAKIVLNPVFVRDIQDYFINIPENMPLECERAQEKLKYKKTKYPTLFIYWLHKQSIHVREGNQARKNYIELAEELQLGGMIKRRQWMLIKGTLKRCYLVAREMNFLTVVTSGAGIGNEIRAGKDATGPEVFTLNPDKFPRIKENIKAIKDHSGKK